MMTHNNRFQEKASFIQTELKRLDETRLIPNAATIDRLADIVQTGELKQPTLLADLLKRPELRYEHIARLAPPDEELPPSVREQVEIQIKYDGYIQRQQRQIHQFKKLENLRIPDTFNYVDVRGLKTEAREKLEKIRPASIGQASRLPGVSPADISILMVMLHQQNR